MRFMMRIRIWRPTELNFWYHRKTIQLNFKPTLNWVRYRKWKRPSEYGYTNVIIQTYKINDGNIPIIIPIHWNNLEMKNKIVIIELTGVLFNSYNREDWKKKEDVKKRKGRGLKTLDTEIK